MSTHTGGPSHDDSRNREDPSHWSALFVSPLRVPAQQQQHSEEGEGMDTSHEGQRRRSVVPVGMPDHVGALPQHPTPGLPRTRSLVLGTGSLGSGASQAVQSLLPVFPAHSSTQSSTAPATTTSSPTTSTGNNSAGPVVPSPQPGNASLLSPQGSSSPPEICSTPAAAPLSNAAKVEEHGGAVAVRRQMEGVRGGDSLPRTESDSMQQLSQSTHPTTPSSDSGRLSVHRGTPTPPTSRDSRSQIKETTEGSHVEEEEALLRQERLLKQELEELDAKTKVTRVLVSYDTQGHKHREIVEEDLVKRMLDPALVGGGAHGGNGSPHGVDRGEAESEEQEAQNSVHSRQEKSRQLHLRRLALARKARTASGTKGGGKGVASGGAAADTPSPGMGGATLNPSWSIYGRISPRKASRLTKVPDSPAAKGPSTPRSHSAGRTTTRPAPIDHHTVIPSPRRASQAKSAPRSRPVAVAVPSPQEKSPAGMSSPRRAKVGAYSNRKGVSGKGRPSEVSSGDPLELERQEQELQQEVERFNRGAGQGRQRSPGSSEAVYSPRVNVFSSPKSPRSASLGPPQHVTSSMQSSPNTYKNPLRVLSSPPSGHKEGTSAPDSGSTPRGGQEAVPSSTDEVRRLVEEFQDLDGGSAEALISRLLKVKEVESQIGLVDNLVRSANAQLVQYLRAMAEERSEFRKRQRQRDEQVMTIMQEMEKRMNRLAAEKDDLVRALNDVTAQLHREIAVSDDLRVHLASSQAKFNNLLQKMPSARMNEQATMYELIELHDLLVIEQSARKKLETELQEAKKQERRLLGELALVRRPEGSQVTACPSTTTTALTSVNPSSSTSPTPVVQTAERATEVSSQSAGAATPSGCDALPSRAQETASTTDGIQIRARAPSVRSLATLQMSLGSASGPTVFPTGEDPASESAQSRPSQSPQSRGHLSQSGDSRGSKQRGTTSSQGDTEEDPGTESARSQDSSTNVTGSGRSSSVDPSLEMGAKKAMVLFSYTATDPRMLSIEKGEILTLLRKRDEWYHARNIRGKEGYAPATYVRIMGAQ